MMATAMAPVIKRVSVPICAVAVRSSLRRASMVLYMPAPGTRGRIPGIMKIRDASLKTLENSSERAAIRHEARKLEIIMD